MRVLLCLGLLASLASAQTTHTVTQQSFNFVDSVTGTSNTNLAVGDTVEWNWTGFGDHTVTEGDDGAINGNEVFTEPLGSLTPQVTIPFDVALFDQLLAAGSIDPGNVVDYFCQPHFGFGQTGTLTFSPWVDRGNGLAGSTVPTLDGVGPFTAGSNNALQLASMPTNSTVFLVVGVVLIDAPLKGGVLGPSPAIPPIPLPTGPTGQLQLPFNWPGVPAGLSLYFQGWIPDAGGPAGFSSTNTLQALQP